MKQLSHTSLITLSGMIWLVIGAMLMALGVHFIEEVSQHTDVYFKAFHHSPLQILNRWTNDIHQSQTILFATCILIGYLKGKWIFSKTVKKSVMRILALPNPTSLKYLYTLRYYFLLALMIGLGISLKYIPFSPDYRGAIDLAVGAALLKGSLKYFKYAVLLKRNMSIEHI